MARSRKDDDDSYLKVSSRENLEEEAQMAKDIIDETASHARRQYRSVADDINKRLHDHESSMASLVAKSNENRNKEFSATQDMFKSILEQTGPGQKFDVNWKSVGLNIGKELLNMGVKIFNTYITEPITSALDDMSSAYESNFTNIAGRMGMMRRDTHNLMHSAVKQLNDSNYKSAINANKELIPALSTAAEKGFKGQEAISVALANAVDSKIMPWLDTSSDAWTNIQYNLSSGMQNTLKAQQLILQESRSGNRLLQSGIINTLTADIAPLLSNIDYNTVDFSDTTKVSAELQGMMQYYLDRGYDNQQAYKAAQEALDIYRNPFKYINSDKASEVLKARAAGDGESISGMLEAEASLTGLAAGAKNHYAAGAIIEGLGVDPGTGGTRVEDAQRRHATQMDIINDTAGYISSALKADEDTYQSIADEAAEKITATMEHDNSIQNQTTELSYFLNDIPHGVTLLKTIAKSLTTIIGMLAGKLVGDLVTSFLGNGKVKSLANGAKGFFKQGGSKLRGATSGAARGLANAATKLPGVTATEAGIGSLGLKATLGNIGAGVTGGSASSLLSTAAGGLTVAAPVVVGVTAAKHGITEGVKDLKSDDHKVRGGISIASGVAAGVGGAAVAGGMLAAGAANAWNPVGWGLLIGGTVGVIATSLARLGDEVDVNAEAVKAHSKALHEAYKEEHQERQKGVRDIINNLKDGNVTQEDLLEARTYAVEQGLMTQEEAQNANAEQLTQLTMAYLKATNQMDPSKEEAADNTATNLAADAAKAAGDAQQDQIAEVVGRITDAQYTDTSEYDSMFNQYVKKGVIDETGKVLAKPGEGIDANSDFFVKDADGNWSRIMTAEEAYTSRNEGGGGLNKTTVEVSIPGENKADAMTHDNTGIINFIDNAIANLSDEGKRKSLSEEFGNMAGGGGYTQMELFNMITKLTEAGATTDTWNAAAAQSPGFDDLKVTGNEEISETYALYRKVLKEVEDLYVTFKAFPQEGQAAELWKKIHLLGSQNIPEEDKASIISAGGYHTAEARQLLVDYYGEHYGTQEHEIPKYRVGIDYVPSDRLSEIHEGEAVLNASDAETYRSFKHMIKQVVNLADTRTIDAITPTPPIINTESLDVTALVEAIRSQTTSFNKKLDEFIKAAKPGSTGGISLPAVSAASPGLTAFNPQTSNTRNLYST